MIPTTIHDRALASQLVHHQEERPTCKMTPDQLLGLQRHARAKTAEPGDHDRERRRGADRDRERHPGIGADHVEPISWTPAARRRAEPLDEVVAELQAKFAPPARPRGAGGCSSALTRQVRSSGSPCSVRGRWSRSRCCWRAERIFGAGSRVTFRHMKAALAITLLLGFAHVASRARSHGVGLLGGRRRERWRRQDSAVHPHVREPRRRRRRAATRRCRRSIKASCSRRRTSTRRAGSRRRSRSRS